jgi:hypothetical protein
LQHLRKDNTLALFGILHFVVYTSSTLTDASY